MPELSEYALCQVDDVKSLLGYEDDEETRDDDIRRAINALSWAIPRRAQREFVHTSAEAGKVRYKQIEQIDITRGFVRMGDIMSEPTEVKLWTPDRDSSTDYDVATDLWLMPDTPDRGFPWEFVKIKRSAPQPTLGYWLSVKTDWGFAAIPDDIIQIAAGASMLWILNDVSKLTQLAQQQGRRVRLESLIPSEFIEAVDDYRLFRVS